MDNGEAFEVVKAALGKLTKSQKEALKKML